MKNKFENIGVRKWALRNRKKGVTAVGCVLIMALTACSSEAPTDVITEAATTQISKQSPFWPANFTFDNLKVTNKFTRTVDNETVNFYDYSIDAHQKDKTNQNVTQMMGGDQTLTGEVQLVKRGNSWYDLDE